MVKKPPKQGDQVTTYNLPGSVSDVAVSGLGTYIARVQHIDDSWNTFDVVGFNVKNPKVDPCQRGGSGSQIGSANGYFSGPASERIALRGMQKDMPIDNTLESTKQRLRIEDQTNLDLDNFNTLCTYAVITPRTIPQLVEGFSYRLTY